ncbi:MAG: phage major capsid protein [Christensenellales bacterium]
MVEKKLLEMRAKRENLRLQAISILNKAEKEDRFLSDEENKEVKRMEEEIAKWDDSIKRAENISTFTPLTEQLETRNEEPEIKPMPRTEEKGFRSLGEQLLAVYRAATPGGRLDERLSTRAASGLNETNPTDGGFLVQKDFVAELLKKTFDTGILASKVRKIPISTNANGIRINAIDDDSRTNGNRFGGVQTFWTDEAEKLAGSKPKFRQIDLSLKKLTGLCYATDELLQDSAALESVITQAFQEEFAFKIDDAILHGNGAGQPLGILKSNAIVKQELETGQTEKITVENLVKMWSRLWSRSRQNAVWYINQQIEPLLYMLQVGDKPVYIPAGGLSDSPYATLFGRPVIPLEQCSELGEIGDIILADLSQYLLIDKGGISAASSVHVRFLYDESVFRFVYRVDGQPIWNKPITPYRGSDTISPFIALAKRS